MKLVRILALAVIAIFFVETVKEFIPGFIDGWTEAGDSTSFGNESICLDVKPTDAGTVAVDSLMNSRLKEQVPYTINAINTRGECPVWYKIALVACFPFAIFALFGYYCLIRLVLSVTRGHIFIGKNVLRMRIFIYSGLLMGLIMEVSQYFIYQEWASQIVLNGYEVTDYNLKYPWLAYLTLALFTEIFAAGVKIKEEQDLTI